MVNVSKEINTKTMWTPDQEDAIKTTNKGVIVSAAAGSGKTAVLVERTIRLLCDEGKRIPADSLLAVTFTKDAANQMKTKLADALDKRLEQNPENIWIAEQKDNLCLAKIKTINAFCLDLVNSNIQEFELQSNIKILDDVESAIIFNQSVEEAFEYFYESQPEMMNNLIDRLTENNENSLKQIVSDLYYFLRSLPFADKWCENVISMLIADNTAQSYVDMMCEHYLKEINKALNITEKSEMILTKINVCDKNQTHRKQLEKDIFCIKNLKKAVESKNWEVIYKALVSTKLSTYGIRLKAIANDEFEKAIQEQSINLLKAYYSEYKGLIKPLCDDIKKIGVEIDKGLKDTADLFKSLLKIYKKVEEIAWEKKVDKNSLDFSDVEIMSINLLTKCDSNGKIIRTELAEEIVKNNEYQVILIDEFQDVNNLQDLIFKAISDTDNLEIMGKNVFVVGDVKQSIYRFRQSNPLLFINAKENAGNLELEDLKLISLRQNFRSRKNILDFVNYTFSILMSREIGEIEYDAEEMLYLGAEYSGEDFDTEFLLIKPDDEEDSIPEYLNFDREHYAIACKIKEMILKKVKVFDVKSKTFRDCRSSDFCILSRGNSHGKKMANALDSVGLKAFSEESDGYLRAREIAVMINLLKVIDNPMHDMEFVSVLMSPLFSFSADDMAKIKMLCKSKDGYAIKIYQVLNDFSKDVEADNYEERFEETLNIKLDDKLLKDKCITAIKTIKRLRFYSSGMTIEQLIRKIYDETDFFAVASAFENSKQTRANLRLLLEYASAYEKNSGGGIAGFLRYIDSAEKYNGNFKQAVTVTQGEDSVIIKTIHKSKGLEFPFVFLCGLSKKFNVSDESKPMFLSEKMGTSMKLLDHNELSKTETINYALTKINYHKEALSEELRLLYVAMTRAKEKLFIALNLDVKTEEEYSKGKLNKVQELANKITISNGVTSDMVESCKCFAEWIYLILLCANNNDEFLNAEYVEVKLPRIETGTELTFSIFDEVFKSERNFVSEKSVDNQGIIEDVDKLISKYGFKYQSEETDKPSKITVTEVVRNEKEKEYAGENPEFYPKLPRIADEIGKLSGAEKGTYTHLFMELADYENASRSVENELERLSNGGFLSPKAKSGVYVNAVKHFFESDLYKRLAKSDEVIREKDFLVAFRDLNLPEKYDEIVSENGMLQGVADCIFKEDDGYVLIDYKTDNFKDRSELFKYQTQLELYKAALDMLMDMPIKSCYIYSFKLCDGVEIPLC